MMELSPKVLGDIIILYWEREIIIMFLCSKKLKKIVKIKISLFCPRLSNSESNKSFYGSPIYEKRGLRPADIERLRNLLASLTPDPKELPLVKQLIEAFKTVSASAFNTYEYPPALRPQMVSAAINSLDTLESLTGQMSVGTMNTKIEFGKGSEKLTVVFVEGKSYIVDRGGNLLNSVTVNAVEKKLFNITFEKFPINNILDKLKKGGGTAGTIAVSALVPILLSNAMVGDANASTSKQNVGLSSSSGVVSTQPYIESSTVNGVK